MNGRQYLIFRVGDEYYGIPVSAVEGILKTQTLNRSTGLPVFCDGWLVMNKKRVPVISLRKQFGVNPPQHPAGGRILVASLGGSTTAGLWVDAVSEVRQVEPLLIEPLEADPPGLRRGAARGVARFDHKRAILLDLSSLLPASMLEELAAFQRDEDLRSDQA